MSCKPNWTLSREQVALGVEEFFSTILTLHRKKNSDYASTEDGLRNFRQTAERLGIPVTTVFLVLIEKHMQALENDAKNPNLLLNEGVVDRLRDLACYSGLLYLALKEQTLLQRKEWQADAARTAQASVSEAIASALERDRRPGVSFPTALRHLEGRLEESDTGAADREAT